MKAAAALVLLASGCAFERIEATGKPMSIREARKALVSSLDGHIGTKYNGKPVRLVKLNRHGATFEAGGRSGQLTFAQLRELSIRRSNISAIGGSVPGGVVDVNGALLWLVPGPDESQAYAHFERGAAELFVNALMTLKRSASPSDTREDVEFAAFAASAKTWLASGTRMPMPDDVLADKASAEEAFKRKDFMAAVFSYGDALEKYPHWPEGHYNAALLAAEVEDFELAAHHMRRYLALAPDAKDAVASKSKYLLWLQKTKP